MVKPNGLIVTNAHVVHGSSTVEVTMQNGTKYQGQVQHLDPVADLATVKINAVRHVYMVLSYDRVPLTSFCVVEKSSSASTWRFGRRASRRVRHCDGESVEAEQHSDGGNREHGEASEWRPWHSWKKHRLHSNRCSHYCVWKHPLPLNLIDLPSCVLVSILSGWQLRWSTGQHGELTFFTQTQLTL